MPNMINGYELQMKQFAKIHQDQVKRINWRIHSFKTGRFRKICLQMMLPINDNYSPNPMKFHKQQYLEYDETFGIRKAQIEMNRLWRAE